MRIKFLIFPLLVILISFVLPSFPDAGIIIPLDTGDGKPDESKISIHRMDVKVTIDNGYATVNILQVFHNHTSSIMEGQYIFVIPSSATISDFAVWDDNVRIPGVILEKKRARKIYEEILQMTKDPGLLETTDDEAELHRFRARLFPIRAGGTKRLELQYTEKLDLSNLVTYFTLPFKPTVFKPQNCVDFRLNIDIVSNHKLMDFKLYPNSYNIKVTQKENKAFNLSAAGQNVLLKDNVALEYKSDVEGVQFDFLTYRNAERFIYDPDPYHGYMFKDKKGYFFASTIFNLPPATKKTKGRDLVILLDVSLSMQWNRLAQAYGAIEYFIKNLKSGDRLQVVLFNDEVKTWEKKLLPISPERAESALTFVKNSYLTGGTDLLGALKEGLSQIKANPHINEPYLVVITDGHPTMNELRYKNILEILNKENSRKATTDNPREYFAHVFIYGIGDKTNLTLLKRLIENNDGYFSWVTDTEDQEFKLRSFLQKVGADIIKDIRLIIEGEENIEAVYPETQSEAFNKSEIIYVGTYKEPRNNVKVTFKARRGTQEFSENATVNLPAEDLTHSHIPRMWAKARVDKLLDLINFEGEKEEWIKEVIALAKQYKFVTPYTSFLAAPRSLLRPRFIKPGDPVLRVRTDDAIVSIVAQFPFGLVKPLRYIADEDVWEVRFLAPKEMKDSKYQCLLHLMDKDGNTYRETKSFIIDSKAPDISPVISKVLYKPGEKMVITARADADTRRLQAKLGIGIPIDLRYNTAEKASVGELVIPENLPSGKYTLQFFAEDFAHNHSTASVDIEIVGR
ncbi:MAG: VWA domain-containing protein [Acidobacteria bacterium]|nr:VWA domain-containing protein [Acidobacteriota bacterium]